MDLFSKRQTAQPGPAGRLGSVFGRPVAGINARAWPADISGGSGALTILGGSPVGSNGLLGTTGTRARFVGSLVGSDYTLVAVATGGSFGSNDNLVGADPNPPRHFQLRVSSISGRFDFIRFNAAGSAFTATTTASVDPARPYVVVATTNSSGAMSVYAGNIGGAVSSASATITGTPSALLATEQIAFGERGESTLIFSGVMYLGAALQSSVGPGAAAEIIRNPWALIEPRRILVPVSAGGATSHDATGALAADAATVAGTATHYTLHASSGALEAQAAVVAGTATHLTLHTATGALAADAATVSGAAALTSTGSFTSSGALSADAATVAGVAVHYTLHTATGVLVADPASVSGAAVDETTFVPTKNTGAGKSRKRRERYEVEIDGEVFPAASVEEAHAILEQAKEQAKAVADLAVTRAAKAKKRRPQNILRDAEKALQLPEIKAPPELQSAADAAMADIQALYEQAAQAIEIEAAMRRREAEIEADDEDILLLL